MVRTARTAVGDEVRRIAYVTDDSVERLYLRADLEADGSSDGLAGVDRTVVRATVDAPGAHPRARPFTVRERDDGYRFETAVDGRGVVVTTDEVHPDRFDELAVALGRILADLDRISPRQFTESTAVET